MTEHHDEQGRCEHRVIAEATIFACDIHGLDKSLYIDDDNVDEALDALDELADLIRTRNERTT